MTMIISTTRRSENFYICAEHKKNKSNCPVTARIVDTELMTVGAHSHNSTKQKSQMLKQEVIKMIMAGSDARPLRILANITSKILNQTLGGVNLDSHPKKESSCEASDIKSRRQS